MDYRASWFCIKTCNRIRYRQKTYVKEILMRDRTSKGFPKALIEDSKPNEQREGPK